MDTIPLLEQSHQYVTFRIGKELFGFHIKAVQQIIPRIELTSVPRTPDYFLGILNLRGETISTIDLRVLFKLSPIPSQEEQRIVIMDFGKSNLGVLVDFVEGVVNVSLGEVRPPSPLLDPGMVEYLIGSYQIDEETILLLLDQNLLLLPDDFHWQEINIQQDNKPVEIGELIMSEPDEVLLGFELEKQQYVLGVDVVEEIIEYPTLTRIPRASHIIEGVFHLRKEVIPLIRLSQRLNLLDNGNAEESTVLVVNVAGVKLGIIVGKIQEVLRIPESRIEPLPENLSGAQAKNLRGIIQSKSQGELVIQSVLVLDQLFSEEELARLADFQKNEVETETIADDEEGMLLLLRFKIAGEPYAIRLHQINQIIKLSNYQILPVPKAPACVQGIINIRGEIVTVLDIPRLLNRQFPLDEDLAKIVVVDLRGRKVGFIVDEVIGTATVSNKIFDVPENWWQDQKQPLVEAIGRETDGQVTVLLDSFAAFDQATRYSQEVPDSSSQQSLS